MNLIHKISTTLLLFWPLALNSQINAPYTENIYGSLTKSAGSYRPKDVARQQIQQLKNGVLLIRLQSKENTINALKKVNRINEAEKVAYEQKTLNQQYIDAFRNYFDFCKVYFFYSNHSQNIIDKKYENVIFLNDSLVEDSTIKISSDNVFTGEFTTLEQDTAKYFSRTIDDDGGIKGNKKLATYHGGPDFSFEVLVIKSDQLIQLRDPFPYYVRTFGKLPLNRNPNTTVNIMNERLHQFYFKQQNRKKR